MDCFFKPGPLVTVPGPTLAENRPKTDQNQNLDFTFLIYILVSMECGTKLSVATLAPRGAALRVEPSLGTIDAALGMSAKDHGALLGRPWGS
jgi:hypothetical protein